MEGYCEAARAVRVLGYKCIEKRIKAIHSGEEIPKDILSQILRIKSTSAVCISYLPYILLASSLGNSQLIIVKQEGLISESLA